MLETSYVTSVFDHVVSVADHVVTMEDHVMSVGWPGEECLQMIQESE